MSAEDEEEKLCGEEESRSRTLQMTDGANHWPVGSPRSSPSWHRAWMEKRAEGESRNSWAMSSM